jgi:NADPH:quinone reductase-like Zn-dependent oxidoreductase
MWPAVRWSIDPLDAAGGCVNDIGRLGAESLVDSSLLYRSVVTVRVVFAGSRGHFIEMNRAIAANRVRPVIDRVFPFDEAIEASSYFENAAVRENRACSRVT